MAYFLRRHVEVLACIRACLAAAERFHELFKLVANGVSFHQWLSSEAHKHADCVSAAATDGTFPVLVGDGTCAVLPGGLAPRATMPSAGAVDGDHTELAQAATPPAVGEDAPMNGASAHGVLPALALISDASSPPPYTEALAHDLRLLLRMAATRSAKSSVCSQAGITLAENEDAAELRPSALQHCIHVLHKIARVLSHGGSGGSGAPGQGGQSTHAALAALSAELFSVFRIPALPPSHTATSATEHAVAGGDGAAAAPAFLSLVASPVSLYRVTAALQTLLLLSQPAARYRDVNTWQFCGFSPLSSGEDAAVDLTAALQGTTDRVATLRAAYALQPLPSVASTFEALTASGLQRRMLWCGVPITALPTLLMDGLRLPSFDLPPTGVCLCARARAVRGMAAGGGCNPPAAWENNSVCFTFCIQAETSTLLCRAAQRRIARVSAGFEYGRALSTSPLAEYALRSATFARITDSSDAVLSCEHQAVLFLCEAVVGHSHVLVRACQLCACAQMYNARHQQHVRLLSGVPCRRTPRRCPGCHTAATPCTCKDG
ncbi:hypothetical protein EON66_00815 [archaeon]|nr:MAG: hypothetical protein EON66_00815 [archaeon]